MIVWPIASLIVALAVAGYVYLIRRSSRGALPAVSLFALVCCTFLLSARIENASQAGNTALVYFSVMDLELYRSAGQCFSKNAGSGSGPCSRQHSDLTAIVSARALEAAESVKERSFKTVRVANNSLRERNDISTGLGFSDPGLTLEDVFVDLAKYLDDGGDLPSDIFIVTPRTSSIAKTQSLYRSLAMSYPDVVDRIHFVSARELGWDAAIYGVDLRIDAPASVSVDADKYDVALRVENTTGKSIDLSLMRLRSGVSAAERRQSLSAERSSEPESGTLVTRPSGSEVIPFSGRTFALTGDLTPALPGNVSTVFAVAKNAYGETLAATSAFTETRQPTIGVLIPTPTIHSIFYQFAQRSAGIHVKPVFVDLTEASTAEGDQKKLQDLSAELSKWGMLVVDSALNRQQASRLARILGTPSSLGSAPALLFIGAGAEELHASFVGDIEGWGLFLGPLGINGFEGSRKIGIAADMSGSVRPVLGSIRDAIEALYNKERGLGSRNSRLLQSFCRFGRKIEPECDEGGFKNQGANNDSFWEGGDHLTFMNDYAKNHAVVAGPKKYYLFTDLVLFWDATDICGETAGCRSIDPHLAPAAAQALKELQDQGVILHIISFKGQVDPSRNPPALKGSERMFGFGGAGEKDKERFQKEVLSRLIGRLPVRQGVIEHLPNTAQLQIKNASENTNLLLINSLLPASAGAAITAQGADILLLASHPSGFSSPLLALKRKVPIGEPSQNPTNLTVGYLGLDLATEFASDRHIEPDRRNGLAALIFSSVNAMGGKLRQPPLQWLFRDRAVAVMRDDRKPFIFTDPGLTATVRRTDMEEREEAVGWDQKSLAVPSIPLDQLKSGGDYDVVVNLCYFEESSDVSAGKSCMGSSTNHSSVEVKLPVVGPVPVLLSESAYTLFVEPNTQNENKKATTAALVISKNMATMIFILWTAALGLIICRA